MGCNYTDVIAKPCEVMMPERERQESKTNGGERHRHTGMMSERGSGNWELANLGFSVSRSHINTFSGFGSFYSFFVQIKIIDSRLVIMQSNTRACVL